MVNSKSRAITLLAVLLIGGVVLVVSLSASGYFDPIPDGESGWQAELDSLLVPAGSTEVRWLNKNLAQSPLLLEMTARYDSGESDSAYGLLLEQEHGTIAVMISPLGYAAVLQQPFPTNSEAADYYLPWQTWPHIRTGDQVNELLVYLNGDTMTVRVNREWLWEADGIEEISGVGIIGESFGEDATIDFQSAEISAVETSK